MMQRRMTTAVCFALFIMAGPTMAQAGDYAPTGVAILHGMLEDQCSFAPDLDVGCCCAVHDEDYAIGGNEIDRWIADRKFRTCIRSKGRPVVAQIYYVGVRSFGWLFFNYGGSTQHTAGN